MKAITLAVFVAVLCATVSLRAQEKRPQQLRLAYGAASSARIPYWLAREAKLDEKYEALEAAIEDMTPSIPELKGKKAADFSDASLIAELDKEAFFEQLKR